MICPGYLPMISGASRYFSDVCRKFAEKGIYIDVITNTLGKKEIKKEGKITIHRLPYMEWRDKKNFMQRSQNLFKYLKKLFARKKFDLISSQHLYSWSFLNPGLAIVSNQISMNQQIPNILTIHTEMDKELDHINNIPVRMLFWDKIICVSNNSSEAIHSLEIDIDKIATCYPGVDLEKFKPGLGKKWLRSRINVKEKDRIFLFAGRLSEDKGLPDLFKAFSTIAQNKQDVKLLVAAAKCEESEEEFQGKIEKLYEKAKLLEIENKIHIHSFEMDEMPLVYNGCDVFVLPSKAEGFGLVYAEAMACGLPVIGTSVGGVPEIITNGEDGFLVSPENPTELAKVMESLLKSKKKRQGMAQRGIEKIKQKFDLNKNIEKLIGISNSIIKKNKKI